MAHSLVPSEKEKVQAKRAVQLLRRPWTVSFDDLRLESGAPEESAHLS